MKIEKLTENVLKITMSHDDLQKRNIDVYSFNPASAAAQKLIREITERAKIAADSFRLSFEDFTYSKDGLVAIMKIEYDLFSPDDSFESFESAIKNRYQRSEIILKRKNRTIYSHILIYTFNSMDDFICGAREIAEDFNGESSLFEYKGVYYLALVSASTDSGWHFYIDGLLSEYGKKVKNSSYVEGFLNEYGEKIFEVDAVGTACKFL